MWLHVADILRNMKNYNYCQSNIKMKLKYLVFLQMIFYGKSLEVMIKLNNFVLQNTMYLSRCLKKYQFLFDAGEAYAFMDQETFEQIEIAKDFIGDDADFLQDGMVVEIEFYTETPIGVAIPDQVTVTVEETEPVVKGQTAANSFKPAICDGGVRVTVPPFIGVGERIIVQTSDRTYLRRAD